MVEVEGVVKNKTGDVRVQKKYLKLLVQEIQAEIDREIIPVGITKFRDDVISFFNDEFHKLPTEDEILKAQNDYKAKLVSERLKVKNSSFRDDVISTYFETNHIVPNDQQIEEFSDTYRKLKIEEWEKESEPK
jgi:hypothetical protein